VDAVPDDFAEFVAAHGHRIRAACHELTSNGQVAEAMGMDLLAAVALRWRWWRPAGRGAAGARYLDRLVRRETRTWRRDVRQTRSATGRIRVIDDTPGPSGFADRAWAHARTLRMRRRLVAAGTVAFLGCVALLGPPPSSPAPAPLPTLPPPTAPPPDVNVLPPFAALARLGRGTTVLPGRINAEPGAALPLASSPVDRAIALVRPDLGPVLVVAPDGTTRRVDNAELAGARLLTTSLSPDGLRGALIVAGGLLVIDVTTGAVRVVAAGAVQPTAPILVWRTSRTALLPAGATAMEVNVDSGTTTPVPDLNGLDVVTSEGGPGPPKLIELVSTSVALPPRIRIRHGVGPGQLEDRPVFGPPWIGKWIGPGWSTEDIAARICASDDIPPLGDARRARMAVGVVRLSGLYGGTLVSVDTTTLEILGFADPQTVLLSAHSPQLAALILAWTPGTTHLALVSTLTRDAGISLPSRLP
jgi:hypothetical protein